MNKTRLGLLLAGFVGFAGVAHGQTVEQGKKFYYYQRYKSAQDALQKVLAANPNNAEAVYWLAETQLALKDSIAAQATLQKALQTNGNVPLLLCGMGQVELRMGKAADARQRFETAISLTKAKDVEVFNAVGRANADYFSKAGDPPYGIEKLNLATETKKFNNPETYVLMGDCYRKLIDGGNAVTAYNKALAIDPKLAEAKFKIGIIYLTQNNKEYFLPAFEEATQMDPNYAPAFYQLYLYWFFRDINKAKDYFDKYLAVSDPDPSNDYDRISILYATGKYNQAAYQQAIDQAKAKISSLGDQADPRYYKLVAYATYDGLKDSVTAKNYLDQYFAKQKAGDFVPKDYTFRAEILSKFPGNDSLVTVNFATALAMDTIQADKQDIIKEALDNTKASGNKVGYAHWTGEQYRMTKDPGQSELYNWGIANYQAGAKDSTLYDTAANIFCNIYETKYPNEIYGYLWCARTMRALDDSTGSKGLAVGPYDKLAQEGRAMDSTAKAANGADSIKYRTQVVESYFFLASYYNDIKKDKAMAIAYLNKVLEVDPNNATAHKFIEILSRPPARPAPAPAKPKPGASGSHTTHHSTSGRR